MSTKIKHGKAESQSGKTWRKRGLYYTLSIAFLAFGLGCLHVYHVSTMFENDRHFSHLSSLEREMAFYTEMGLYYSYYKTLVEAPTYLEGLVEITHDTRTEYPSVINTLQRFNLYPEVVIALMYRGFRYGTESFNITARQCWQVERGNGLLPVLSCEGLGDPAYFYLEMVWISAALTVALIFLYGHMISGTVAGGALSVICFFYNHAECTRVQWTPPLRESFAYPFCVLQMLSVTKCLFLGRTDPSNKNNSFLLSRVLLVWIPTWIFLVLWQFAQFVLTTQLLAVFVLYVLGIIKKDTLLPIVFGYAFAISHAALSLFVNEFLIFSFLTASLIAILVLSISVIPVTKRVSYGFRVIFLSILTPFIIFIVKAQLSFFSNNKDDMHIINLLKAKLFGYKDFHTLLYTCSPEFDFLPWEFVKNVTQTLLLPAAVLAAMVVVFHWAKTFFSKQGKNDPASITARLRAAVQPEIAYNFLQIGAFGIMAAMVMRLKLFFTPHLCVMVSLLAAPKYSPWRSNEVRLAAIFLLIGGMSVKGIQNIKAQRDILGEYSNVPMEQLLNWINTNTNPEAVFAGPMPVMANVLLSTRRPIVNHPHYEDADLRARTKKVYSVFSRKTSQEVYFTLSQMKVDYIILGEAWCFDEGRKGCSMRELWDVEEPHNAHHPPVCPTLFRNSPAPFVRVFSNDVYVVLQVHPQSQYVELQSPISLKQ